MSATKLNAFQLGVVQRLRKSADIFEERAAVYKDNYKAVGRVVEALFPDGHTQHSQEDHNRWHLFELVIVKLTRYVNNYDDGGHEDSVDDMIVYLSMLGQLDAEHRAASIVPKGNELAPPYGTLEYWSVDWWGDPFQLEEMVLLRHHWGKGETYRVMGSKSEGWVTIEDIAGNTSEARQEWLRPVPDQEEPNQR